MSHVPRSIGRLALACLMVVELSGCAGSARKNYPAETMRRDSDGSTLQVMPAYPVACQDDPDRERFALTYARRRNRFNESVYEISVVNIGRTGLVVAEGETLHFREDGNGAGFRTFGASDTLRSANRTTLIAATYIVQYADLSSVAEANAIQLTIDANGMPLDRCFDSGSRANLKRFIAAYPPE